MSVEEVCVARGRFVIQCGCVVQGRWCVWGGRGCAVWIWSLVALELSGCVHLLGHPLQILEGDFARLIVIKKSESF